jgi:hypothetical protein
MSVLFQARSFRSRRPGKNQIQAEAIQNLGPGRAIACCRQQAGKCRCRGIATAVNSIPPRSLPARPLHRIFEFEATLANRVLVLFYFEVRKGGCPDMIRTSKSEHDASMTAGHAPENGLQRGHEHVFWSRSAAYTGVLALYAITLASQPRLARFAGPRHRDASSALERWTSRQQTALCAAYHRHRTTEVRHLCLPFIDQISS